MALDEFNPYKYFMNLLRYWWVVFLAALLGGVVGFIFFQFHPPIYEATATYLVTIDQTQFPFQGVREDLIQYNEDLAINTTGGILLSTPVLNQVVDQLKAAGKTITTTELLQNYTIERKQETWELRYRSQVPLDAQAVVNAWAQVGYQALLANQASGKVPKFVIFQPPSQASIPTEPVVYGLNKLILAGALIGLVMGIIISSRISRPIKTSSSDA